MMPAARRRPRLAFIRGSYVNPFETQYLEPLADRFDIVIAYPRSHRYSVSGINLPLHRLHCVDFLDGFVPRDFAGVQVPNPMKAFGRDEWVLGLSRFLAGFDLVHIAEKTFYFSYQVARLKKSLGFGLVTTQCEINPFWFTKRPGAMRRASAVIEATDLFAARSERAGAALVTEGVEPDRISVIGHGVDTSRFKPGPRDPELCRRFGVEPGRLVILLVARLVWEKGLYALADAMANLERDPSFRQSDPLIIIAGDGPERQAFRRRLELLGIGHRFRLLGGVPYSLLPEVHRMADIFVLPSISTKAVLEQFGIALIEAMATGTPVISTHCGAIDEVVGDAGVLVQPNDHLRLAESIKDLCLSADRRRLIGNQGRRRLLDNFTSQVISEKLSCAYEGVLAKRRAIE